MSEAIKNAIDKYIALRDKKKEMATKHKEELAPINNAMARVEAAMQRILLQQGAKNISTTSGTAYLSTTVKATIQDWTAFKQYVDENDLIDMMEHRVSKEAVEEFRDAQDGALPPGIAITETIATRFKRGR